MKKCFTLTVFTLTITTFLTAQPQQDSLWSIWSDQSLADTSRLKAINRIIWDKVLFSRPDSATQLANLQFALAEEKANPKYLSTALNNRGISFAIQGLDSLALNSYKQGLQLATDNHDSTMMANITVNIGVIYSNQGNQVEALKNYESALAINQRIGNKSNVARCLLNIGTIYHKQTDYDQALDYYKRSLDIFGQQSLKRVQASILTNIGSIYTELEQYKKARENYEQSSELMAEINYAQGMGVNYANIGNTYTKEGALEKGMEYFEKSLEVETAIGKKAGIAETLEKMGYNLQLQGKYEEAQITLEKSLQTFTEIPDQYGIGSVHIQMGQGYREAGNYKKAIHHCKQGLVIQKELANEGRQKDACQCLYETYALRGDFENAFLYHKEMFAHYDSIKSDQTLNKIQAMEFEKQLIADSLFQAEKRHELELAFQKEVAEKDKTQNFLLSGGFILILLAGGLFTRNRMVTKSRTQIRLEKDRSDELLLNILPEETAKELKAKGSAESKLIEETTVLFTDFVGFTEMSEMLSASELVKNINECFSAFDHIMEKHSIEKIKTIGDAYMAAGGLPTPNSTHVKDVVLAALEISNFMLHRGNERKEQGLPFFQIRIGVNTGPVVAGIVGVKKFQYDIWGDTVNTASRMESASESGKVNISESTYNQLKNETEFNFEHRGEIEAKGKGKVNMWYVTKA
jgi:class 3 adenylate cyclase/Tfp pilus assembly protein PilF